jgi:hypothetical protein
VRRDRTRPPPTQRHLIPAGLPAVGTGAFFIPSKRVTRPAAYGAVQVPAVPQTGPLLLQRVLKKDATEDQKRLLIETVGVGYKSPPKLPIPKSKLVPPGPRLLAKPNTLAILLPIAAAMQKRERW